MTTLAVGAMAVFGLGGSPAGASPLDGADLVAEVSGLVTLGAPGSCNGGAGQSASFDSVVITGVFTAGVTAAFVGSVGVGSVSVCSTPVLPPAPVPATGTLGGAMFGGAGLTGTCLSGVLAAGGTFISAGAVSVASVPVSWSVDPDCVGPTPPVASGDHTATAVVEVVPAGTVACAAVCPPPVPDVVVGEVVA